NRVRVNAQLIDGDTGAHLWADRFEESITDLFKLQDQVVARLANTLGYELTKAEAQKSTLSANPDVVDLMMRGWAALWQPPTKERNETARDYFERAIQRHWVRYCRRIPGVEPACEGNRDRPWLCLCLLREEPFFVGLRGIEWMIFGPSPYISHYLCMIG